MDAQSFLKNFGYIAEAPEGVKRLRSMIRLLATTGQLATNISTETSSKALLKTIQIEFQERLSKKEFRKPKVRQKTSSLDSLKILPKNWCWCSLEQIFYPISVPNSKKLPSKQIKQKGRYPVVDQSLAFISGYSDNNKKLIKLDQPVVIFGDHTRALKFVDFNFIPGGDGIKILCPIQINPRYFFLVLQSFNINVRGYARHYQLLLDNYFPLPPLKEQKRIVAKVDELMALCDKLEAQQQERQRLFPVLSRTTHARLVESPTPANLQAIFDETEMVSPDDLRSTLLSLAFKGDLVPQKQDDEPATVLLERITKNISSEGKRGRKSNHQEAKPPYEIPVNWAWSTFPKLGEFGRGKSKHRPRNDPSLYTGGIHPLVQTGDVARSHGIIKSYTGLYNDKGLSQSKKWPAGTLCITIAANIADTGILKFDACFPDSVVGFIPSGELPSVHYFEYFMRTAKKRLEDFAPSTAQKNINLGILSQVLIPIAPVDEQVRIVAKLNYLMGLIDQIEALYNERNAIGKAFTQASVTAITGTRIKEHEKMKAPKTELVTNLRMNKKPKAGDDAPLANIIARHTGGLSAKSLWQQSGFKEIDTFYQQLKEEMQKGWIIEPEKAVMQEVGAR